MNRARVGVPRRLLDKNVGHASGCASTSLQGVPAAAPLGVGRHRVGIAEPVDLEVLTDVGRRTRAKRMEES